MKKLFLIFILALFVISCDEESQNQIAGLRTITQRVEDLNKTKEEIKAIEETAALMKEENSLLEYEYPIRLDESYVTTYRFKNNKCYEIKMDTYLNQVAHAKKVQHEVISYINKNGTFSKTTLKKGIYHWESEDKHVFIDLNIQNIERGIVNLTIQLK